MNRHKLILAAIPLLVVYTGVQAQTTSSAPVFDCAAVSNAGATLKKQQSPTGAKVRAGEASENDRRPSFTNFIAAPKTKPVEFIGLGALKESEALSLLCEKKAFPDNRPLNRAGVRNAASALREILTSRGYANADVHAFAENGTVRFFVNEGIRLPIAELHFEGNRAFSSRRLLGLTNDCLASVGEADNGYDSEKLEYCQRTVLNDIRRGGYFQATLRNTTKIAEKGYVVSFAVNEGTQFRLGKVTIEGAKVFSTDEIRDGFPLRAGDIAKGDSISKWLFEDLKNAYGELGFVEYTAEVLPTFRQDQGLVDLKIEIEEGKRFTLRSIHFVGELIQGVNLEELLTLQPGNIYNHRMFLQSIARLNDTGLFLPVDVDRDVEFSKIDEDVLIQIFIRLKVRK